MKYKNGVGENSTMKKGLALSPNMIIFGIAGILLFIFSLRSVFSDNDFNVYLHAGKRLLEHQNPYAAPHYRGLPYFYSPFFAVIMGYASALPILIPKTIWFLLNFIFIIRSLFLINKHFFYGNAFKNPWITLAVCALGMRYLQMNFLCGQMTIYLIWSILECFYQLYRKKQNRAAFILALAINIKIIPGILLLLLLQQKEYRFLFRVFLFSIFFIFIAFINSGFPFGILLNLAWLNQINPAAGMHSMEAESGFQDIGALLVKYLSDQPIGNEITLHWFSLPLEMIGKITLIARLFLLLFLAIISRIFIQHHKKNNHRDQFHILAYYMAMVPLIFPHQRDYSYLFLLPAVMVFLSNIASVTASFYTRTFQLAGLMVILFFWGPFIGREALGVYTDLWYDLRFLPIGNLFLIALFTKMMIEPKRILANSTEKIKFHYQLVISIRKTPVEAN